MSHLQKPLTGGFTKLALFTLDLHHTSYASFNKGRRAVNNDVSPLSPLMAMWCVLMVDPSGSSPENVINWGEEEQADQCLISQLLQFKRFTHVLISSIRSMKYLLSVY